MNTSLKTLLIATASAAALLGAGSAVAHSNDDAFSNVSLHYLASQGQGWVNHHVRYATGEASELDNGPLHAGHRSRQIRSNDSPSADLLSSDASLDRHLASYTRELLDRGGWHNPHIPNPLYGPANELIAVEVGSGLTTGPA